MLGLKLNHVSKRGYRPLPDTMLIYHQQCPVTFIWGIFHKGYLSHQSLKLAWNLFYLKCHSNLPGANELMWLPHQSIVNPCDISTYGPLIRYLKLWVAHAPGMPGTFPHHRLQRQTAGKRSRYAPRHVRHACAVMQTGIAYPGRRGKRSRH